jgi:triosephosphate isomerase
MILFNWKANGTKELLDEINRLNVQNKNITIIPPIHLSHLIDKSKFTVGTQNVSIFENGAYTGEISAQMLSEIGVKYCLVGHSERRHYLNETNEIIEHKIKNLTKHGITPVLCVGENSLDRANKQEYFVLKNQMSVFTKNCIVAYEPVWAIGTGSVPQNHEIDDVIAWLKNKYGVETVLYGGSVSSKNIENLAKTQANGVLVGAASLKPQEVLQITQYF